MPSSTPTILELNHVALFVRDVARSCQFYADVLRLEQIPRPAFDFPGAWFRLGQSQELHLIGGSNETAALSVRGNHFALRVDDVAGWERHVQSSGALVRGPVKRPDGATQLFLRDPDGHLLELFRF